MTVPSEHHVDAHRIDADGIVHLFEIQFTSGGILGLRDGETVTWAGRTYNQIPVRIVGVARSSDEQVSRPQMTVANPEGTFSRAVVTGAVDNAIVTRKRVLYDDLVNNRNRYYPEVWYVARTASLTKHAITLELRALSDRVNAKVPARTFTPPEFNLVTMQ